MEYTTLGRTGATVSRIGFGGAALGLTNYLETFDPHDAADRAKLFEGIDTALDGGINYFDTAAAYGKGESERVLGEGLKGVTHSAGVPIVLSTKVHPKQFADNVRASLEGSLERLQRDRVDLLQIHGDTITVADADRFLAPGGMAEQMLELKAEGLVGNIGFSTEDNNDSVYRMIGSGLFDTVQLCYNFLFQHPYETSRPFGSMFEAEAQGMGILTMRAPTSGTFQRWIEMVNPANTFDYTPALIQFVLSNPLVDVALVGMRTAEIVRRNLEIADDLSGRLDIATVQERYV
jgi:aryl-alcohol dehydrogenase-like predicted oxidoreductase